jgi:hypothetical protein
LKLNQTALFFSFFEGVFFTTLAILTLMFSDSSAQSTFTVAKYAGLNTNTYSGDGGKATSAGLKQPYGSWLDSSKNLYIPEIGSALVRKISNSQIVTTVAGKI